MTTTVPAAPQFAFNGVVRLTRIGTTYLVFTLVIGFAALNTGNNALYIALTFMLGCLLLSGVASKGGLAHLQVELSGTDQPWAGRPVNVILRVRNRSRIWNVRDVVITSGDFAQPILVPLIEKGTTTEVAATFLFQNRGIVELKKADLYTRYPFGFFLKKRKTRLTGELVVFPRLLSDEASRDRFKPIVGEQMTANRPGPGTEIHSFRDYVRGDSLRHVYWRKSAGTGRWIVKQTEAEAAHAVHVVVDTYKPRSSSNDEFEEMISAAATFIFHATGRGLKVMLSLPRLVLEAADSHDSASMFRALALVQPVHEPVYMTIDRNSVLFSLRREDESASA